MQSVRINDPVVGEAEVIFKSIKNIYLAVLPPDGRLRVSAPFGTPLSVLLELLAEKRTWVLKQRAKWTQCPPQPQLQFVSGAPFSYFGQRYTLCVCSGSRFDLRLAGSTAYLTVKDGADPEKTAAFVLKWQRAALRGEIEKRLPLWEARTGLSCSTWQIKNMKTRWGTCNTVAKRLWFNLKLVQKPYVCLDYVLLHELAHLRYPDHGKAFWAFVQSFMPQYREIQKRLNTPEQAYAEN